jgi:DNA-binding NtrC family response regulator
MEIRPHIPVILCSGYSEHISAEKAAALGIRKFIMKPIQKKIMAEAIREALEE